MDFVSPIIIHYTVFEDNNGPLGLDISLSKSPRNRHIAVKFNFFRIHVGEDRGIMIQGVYSKYQKTYFLSNSYQKKNQYNRKSIS